MKLMLTATVAATAVLLASSTANAQMAGLKSMQKAATEAAIVHKTGRRGRRRAAVGAGIALGILGAAAAAHAAREDDYDRSYRHERRCNRWRRWCRNGEREACWKYDNRC